MKQMVKLSDEEVRERLELIQRLPVKLRARARLDLIEDLGIHE